MKGHNSGHAPRARHAVCLEANGASSLQRSFMLCRQCIRYRRRKYTCPQLRVTHDTACGVAHSLPAWSVHRTSHLSCTFGCGQPSVQDAAVRDGAARRLMTEQQQQQQDPSSKVRLRQPMQQLAAAKLAQVVLRRNSGLLTSSCLSAQKRRCFLAASAQSRRRQPGKVF